MLGVGGGVYVDEKVTWHDYEECILLVAALTLLTALASPLLSPFHPT